MKIRYEFEEKDISNAGCGLYLVLNRHEPDSEFRILSMAYIFGFLRYENIKQYTITSLADGMTWAIGSNKEEAIKYLNDHEDGYRLMTKNEAIRAIEENASNRFMKALGVGVKE